MSSFNTKKADPNDDGHFEHYPSVCSKCFATVEVGGQPIKHFCTAIGYHYLKAKTLITDWEFHESDEDELNPHSDPTEHIYVHLCVRKYYREKRPLIKAMLRDCEYVLGCEERKNCKLYDADGKRIQPARSDNHTVIQARVMRRDCGAFERDEYEALKRRWFDSIVNGHTTRRDKVMRFCMDALVNEICLVRYLQNQGQRIVDIPQSMILDCMRMSTAPQIHIRFSKAVGDYHDNDSSVGFMIGGTEEMQTIVMSRIPALMRANNINRDYSRGSINLRNKAAALIAVPLTCFMRTTREAALEKVIEELRGNYDISRLIAHHLSPEDGNPRVRLHSQLACNLIEGLKERVEGVSGEPGEHWAEGQFWAETPRYKLPEEDKQFLPWVSAPDCHKDPSELSILLAVYDWEDHCEVGVASGKRWLTETPLDACLRETNDKMLIDLSDVHIRKNYEKSIKELKPQEHNWMLVLHTQLNLNCYIFTHRSMYL